MINKLKAQENKMKSTINGLLAVIQEAQSILVKYLPPDSPTAHQTVVSLLDLLDGSMCRTIVKRAESDIAQVDGVEQAPIQSTEAMRADFDKLHIVHHGSPGYGRSSIWNSIETAAAWTAYQAGRASPLNIAQQAPDTMEERVKVHGEADVEWVAAERIADIPEVDGALRAFSEDPTGDSGTMLVRDVMRVLAKQATQADVGRQQ